MTQVRSHHGVEAVIGELADELRAELAARAKDVAAEVRAELKKELVLQNAAISRHVMASVKEHIHGHFGHAYESAQAEARNTAKRIEQIEDELKATTRLATSLASRAIDETVLEARVVDKAADKERNDQVISEMTEAVGLAIQNVFKGSSDSFLVGKGPGNSKDIPDNDSTRSASAASDISSEASVTPRVPEDHPLPSGKTEPHVRLISEDLLGRLQGLADDIDRTSKSQRSAPDQSKTIAACANGGQPYDVSTCDAEQWKDCATPRGCSAEHVLLMKLAAARPQSMESMSTSDAEHWNDGAAPPGCSAEHALLMKVAAPRLQICKKQRPTSARCDSAAAQLPPQEAGPRQLLLPVSITRMEADSFQRNEVETAVENLPTKSICVPPLQIPDSPFFGSTLKTVTPGHLSPHASVSGLSPGAWWYS